MTEAPIGVFDSGVGGLSVLRPIRMLLPNEDLLYVADSGAAPYGDRSEQFIRDRVHAIVAFFHSQRVKAIVVACNTATAVAIEMMRSQSTIPIIAMEPAIKPAAKLSKSGVVGVLATNRTLASESFSRLADQYSDHVEIILQVCPGFVEQVEKGDLDGAETKALVATYVSPLIENNVDTIVLGCTHYPFLLPVIEEVSGPAVKVVDSSSAVARQVYRRLKENDLLSPKDLAGTVRFWTSGIAQRVYPIVAQLWGVDIQIVPLPAKFAVSNSF